MEKSQRSTQQQTQQLLFQLCYLLPQLLAWQNGAGTMCHNQFYTAPAPAAVAAVALSFSQAHNLATSAGTTCHNQLYGVLAGLTISLVPPQAPQGSNRACMPLAVQEINPTPGSNDFSLTGGMLEEKFKKTSTSKLSGSSQQPQWGAHQSRKSWFPLYR